MTVRQIGEERLLAQILSTLPRDRRLIAKTGDDCAVVKFSGARDFLLLKSDCVVEGVHFTPKAKPEEIGWKAMMRTLSDFAAMAGVPEFALITLMISPGKKVEWVRKLYRGLGRAASRFDVAIAGGETSEGPTAITVSASGRVEPKRCVLRSGGKSNDDLFVTGKLGGAIRGRHLRFLPRIEEARWLARNFSVHAMIDLSDGLGSDLPRLAQASKVGFQIDKEALPLASGCSIEQAISDGEDYELLFAISPRHRRKLMTRWKGKFPKVRLTRIGRFTRRSSLITDYPSGYVHFQKRR